MILQEAKEILGYPKDADEVRRTFRRLAQDNHPDHGGDGAVFLRVVEAKTKLLKYFAERPLPKCPVCDGKGKVIQQQGWTTHWIRCQTCKGNADTTR